ncbi:hypothetical protein PRIPAC_90925 [Pristionchus pacificus]|uniref:Uncharacterized protein n=1 Tax=Pristionchus pacificus TaxID=54126 RepID=A0A2A6D3F2_PRIPA|nr:hypothetical protein PRIPAC_90925 [Pristionchus pacificus]|eukprot:PDM84925.1 hypothetical protein PRIPAC_36359 [Pristionchus pacificus]
MSHVKPKNKTKLQMKGRDPRGSGRRRMVDRLRRWTKEMKGRVLPWERATSMDGNVDLERGNKRYSTTRRRRVRSRPDVNRHEMTV